MADLNLLVDKPHLRELKVTMLRPEMPKEGCSPGQFCTRQQVFGSLIDPRVHGPLCNRCPLNGRL